MSLSNESNDLHLKEIIKRGISVQFDKFSKLILAQRSLSIKGSYGSNSTFS
jgi:hypothetical protein